MNIMRSERSAQIQTDTTYPVLVQKWVRNGTKNKQRLEIINLIDRLRGEVIRLDDELAGTKKGVTLKQGVDTSALQMALVGAQRQIDELVEQLHERALVIEAFRLRLRSAENALATISCENPDLTTDDCQRKLVDKLKFYADRHLSTPGRIDTSANPYLEGIDELRMKRGFAKWHAIQEARKGPVRYPNKLHPSHQTRVSIDASSYDEICEVCGATDIAGGGWGELRKPCPGSAS